MWLNWVSENSGQDHRYGCAVHGYVLMTYHVHLLVTPCERESLVRMVQYLGRCYVMRKRGQSHFPKPKRALTPFPVGYLPAGKAKKQEGADMDQWIQVHHKIRKIVEKMSV